MKNFPPLSLPILIVAAMVLNLAPLPCSGQSDSKSQTNFVHKSAENWHQWRGPDASGMAINANPPTSWSNTKNVAWKVSLPGEGSSTPIIWGDKLFLVAAVETDRTSDGIAQHKEAKTAPTGNVFDFLVICLDRNSGKEIWKKTVASLAPHEGRHSSTTYAAASPMTDGKHLYASFGSYGLFCMTLDGTVVWERDLGDMRTRKGWGEAVSPVVADDKVIVMWDQEDQSEIFVLNGKTGKTIWSKKRDEPTTWATPLPIKRNGKTQIVTPGTNHVRSYDLESGELVWQTKGLTVNAIPCPVLHNDHAICMSGYRGNAAVSIDLAAADSARDAAPIKWQLQRDTPYVASPLLTDGRLYFLKSLNPILSCVDADTGKTIFGATRLPGLKRVYASPVATKDHIFISSREGVTLVLENGPELKVIATNDLGDGIDASPAIVGDSIYIRTRTHLYRIKE